MGGGVDTTSMYICARDLEFSAPGRTVSLTLRPRRASTTGVRVELKGSTGGLKRLRWISTMSDFCGKPNRHAYLQVLGCRCLSCSKDLLGRPLFRKETS